MIKMYIMLNMFPYFLKNTFLKNTYLLQTRKQGGIKKLESIINKVFVNNPVLGN